MCQPCGFVPFCFKTPVLADAHESVRFKMSFGHFSNGPAINSGDEIHERNIDPSAVNQAAQTFSTVVGVNDQSVKVGDW